MRAQKQLPKRVSLADVDVDLLSDEERSEILRLAEEVARLGAHNRISLASPNEARRFVGASLRNRDREVFLVIFLDTKIRVLASEEMFLGTIDSCTVHPREVVRRALAVNAHSCILAHPHPSGEPEPSSGDRQLTDQLRRALELVEVRLLDHLVVGVGSGKIVSFAERGWL